MKKALIRGINRRTLYNFETCTVDTRPDTQILTTPVMKFYKMSRRYQMLS